MTPKIRIAHRMANTIPPLGHRAPLESYIDPTLPFSPEAFEHLLRCAIKMGETESAEKRAVHLIDIETRAMEKPHPVQEYKN